MKTEIKLLNYKGKMVPFEISYDIKEGDTVWNISYGGEEHPDKFDINTPAIMLNLNHSTYKPYECHTNLGFGPREHYFKIMNMENKRFKLNSKQ